MDLEAAGIDVIQIDEPALREGLPLRAPTGRPTSTGRSSASASPPRASNDETQIHTHMCYSEFNDIIDAIGAMDADVISIETSRSKMELLDAFVGRTTIPTRSGRASTTSIAARAQRRGNGSSAGDGAGERLSAGQLWVNPDCGLKTRKWEEVRPALVNMVQAAKAARVGQAQLKAILHTPAEFLAQGTSGICRRPTTSHTSDCSPRIGSTTWSATCRFGRRR